MKQVWLLLLVMGFCAFGCTDLWAYSGGDGTPGNPYLISSKADLLELGADTDNYSKNFQMTTHIDLTGVSFTNAVIAPVNNAPSTDGHLFRGYFDGNGYEIRNLTITGNANNVGLFGGLCAAFVTNLCLVDCAIEGSNYVGSVCGWAFAGTIKGCYAAGSVTGHDYVGGMSGWREEFGGIYQSSFAGNVSGHDYVGGLCGYIKNRDVENCSARGQVSGNNYIGGFCGYNGNEGEIANCYAACRIDAHGGFYGDGFCGMNYNVITNCFWDFNRSGLPSPLGWGTPATTAEMQTQSTFSSVGWDFGSTWEMYGYPTLQGLNEPLYGLTVSNGTGAGVYIEWTLVNISAVAPVSDYTFAGWTVEPEIYSNDIVNAYTSSTAFLMPGTGVTLTASFNLYSGGGGTTNDPYLIANKADLLLLAERTNDYDKCFLMTADIDLAGESFTNAVIASGADVYFSGMFDGGGHVISNLAITSSANYIGLFSKLNEGTITALGLTDCAISGARFVSALCARLRTGTISRCYVSGSVSGNSYVGGLCAGNEDTIRTCYALGSVSGTDNVGGLCAYCDGYASISNCYSSAGSSGPDGLIGGLCAVNAGVISRSYSVGSVTSATNTIGGLCANNMRTITASFWDTETSGTTNSAGGTGKTTVEMQTETTFTSAGWDLVDTWFMDDYPQLRCVAENAYARWAEYWNIPADERGYEEEPAGDHIPNLLKYAIGLDPMAACSVADVMQMVIETNDIFILYHKSKQAQYVNLYPQQTETLVLPNWTDNGFETAKIDESASNETWRADMLITNGVTLIRLKAEQ